MRARVIGVELEQPQAGADRLLAGRRRGPAASPRTPRGPRRAGRPPSPRSASSSRKSPVYSALGGRLEEALDVDAHQRQIQRDGARVGPDDVEVAAERRAQRRQRDRQAVGELRRLLAGPQQLHQLLARDRPPAPRDEDLQQRPRLLGLELHRLPAPEHREAAERLDLELGRMRGAPRPRRCTRARSGWSAIATIAVATGPPTTRPAVTITAKKTSVTNAASDGREQRAVDQGLELVELVAPERRRRSRAGTPPTGTR